eukprot:scaffold710229_cov83-Attheya_sp.AAC.1
MDAIWMSRADILSSTVRVGTAASKCMVGGCDVVSGVVGGDDWISDGSVMIGSECFLGGQLTVSIAIRKAMDTVS